MLLHKFDVTMATVFSLEIFSEILVKNKKKMPFTSNNAVLPNFKSTIALPWGSTKLKHNRNVNQLNLILVFSFNFTAIDVGAFQILFS